MHKQLTSLLTLTTTAVIVFGLLITPVQAQVLSLQQLNIDAASVQPDDAFSIPTSIVVIPIFAPTSEFIVQDRDWYRGLFYYLIANERRPGFTDIPFHYVVSGDGRVFKGNSGGEERKISIEGVGDTQVVIGYLADRSERSFDPRSTAVLGELVIDVANKHNIQLDKITVDTVEYVRDDESQKVSLKKVDLFGIWSSSLQDIVKENEFRFAPSKKNYELSVTAVQVPEGKVRPGSVVNASVTIRNDGDFGIYGGSVSELIGTKMEGNSQFYDGSTWLSSSQFPLMSESDVILPDQEKTFDFKLFVPLYFGEQTEQFLLRNIDGATISGSTFDVTLDIEKPEGIVVEVRATETGWLRVRSQPSGAATEIDRISVGSRYFQIDDAGNGWVKIDLGEGREGWVSILYLNYL